MADVRLDFYDLDDDALPDVCMKCGAESTARPVKTFSWMPYWARFMPYGVGLAFMKRRRVPVPLCDRHKNHWVMRYVVIFGGLAAFLLLFILGGVAAAVSDNPGADPLKILAVLLFALGGVLFLAWLVTAIVLGVTQINVFEITDDTITLRNVSPEFVRAYREAARGDMDPELDRAAREQWSGRRRRRDDDDDDEPPPRRRASDDKYRR